MIKLNTFTIKERNLTINWSDLSLLAIDKHSNKIVSIACCSFATGAAGAYPGATKDNAKANLDKLQKYLIDNDIKSEWEWAEKATAKAKTTFASCFTMSEPFFSNEG